MNFFETQINSKFLNDIHYLDLILNAIPHPKSTHGTFNHLNDSKSIATFKIHKLDAAKILGSFKRYTIHRSPSNEIHAEIPASSILFVIDLYPSKSGIFMLSNTIKTDESELYR